MIIYADLHLHSTYSDGRGSPFEIVYTAFERGLNAIAITDHDTFAGVNEAQRLSVQYGILVVPGIEVRTDHGDILVYCNTINVNLPRRVDLLLERAHKEGCLVVPAHPFDIAKLGIGDLIYEYRGWDAIEVWNASSTKGSNYKAIRAAKYLGKPGLANSDAHLVEEIGSAYNTIEVDDLKVDSVLDSIKRGRVKPFYGMPSLKTRVNRLAWSIRRSFKKFWY